MTGTPWDQRAIEAREGCCFRSSARLALAAGIDGMSDRVPELGML